MSRNIDAQDLLATDEQNSDVTLIVNGSKFKVHKTALSAKSPVFTEMFSHKNPEETEINEIIIKNTNPEAMKIFLEFIHSGKIEKLDKEKFDLWILADKYQIETLKSYCEQFIFSNLNEQGVLEIFRFADLHNLKSLLDKAWIYSTKNCRSILLENEEWRQMVQTSSILFDLIVYYATKNA